MAINGYIKVPDSATKGGAPIDAFQADAFRQNDDLFEKLLSQLMLTPLFLNQGTGVANNPNPDEIIKKEEITVNSTVNVVGKVPLVWLATEEIKIEGGGIIDANGKGAEKGETGDFGGSGGGGSGAGNDGKDCLLPVSGHKIISGGGTSTSGNNLNAKWGLRALSVLTNIRGGAAGGDDGSNDGGNGGGVIVLCAPKISMAGNGKIEAKGSDGSGGDTGGGGGGLVVLIYREKDNVHLAGGSQNIFVDGGNGSGSGGNGGQGLVLELEVE